MLGDLTKRHASANMRIAKGEGQSRGCGDNRARTIAKIRPLLITYLSGKRDEVAEATLAKD